MAAASSADVLLETVEASANTNSPIAEARYELRSRVEDGTEPEKRVAPGEDDGDADRYDQRVVSDRRACLDPRLMDRTCSITVNRPVRTRMPGGVGAGGIKTPRLPD